MTPDQIATAQLNAAVDQARAAWSTAYAAWVQAVATPVGIFAALLAAFYAPWWMRRQEEKRAKILAVNRAGQAAGSIMILRTLANAPESVANNGSEIPIQAIRHALERLESFPRDSLSKPDIDRALTLLELNLQGALGTAPIILEKLQHGTLSSEELASLDKSSARAKELYEDVCRAAGVKISKSEQ